MVSIHTIQKNTEATAVITMESRQEVNSERRSVFTCHVNRMQDRITM
jgi:hypothetical protein